MSDDLPAELQPAPGTTVQYEVARNVRCQNLLLPFTAADGKQGGNKCVSDHTLGQICKAAGHCEQVPFEKRQKLINIRRQ